MNDSKGMKRRFLGYCGIIRLRMGLILSTFFLVTVTAGATIYFLPKRYYYSRVLMEVKSDWSDVISTSTFGPGNFRSTRDPQFIADQFHILQSTEILYPVIERLDLVKEFSPPGSRWSLQQVYSQLLNRMKTEEVRNLGMIEIGVKDTDPQRAADIANTIAVVYQETHQRNSERNRALELEQLKDEMDKLRKEMEAAAEVARQIRVRENIVDSDPDHDNSAIDLQSRGWIED